MKLISASTSMMKTLLSPHHTAPSSPISLFCFPFLCLTERASGSLEGGSANESKCVYLTKKKKGQERSAALGRVAMVIAYIPYIPTTDARLTTPCISVITYEASDWPPSSKSTRHISLFNRLSYHSYLCLSNHDLLHYRYTQSISAGHGAQKGLVSPTGEPLETGPCCRCLTFNPNRFTQPYCQLD